jgi:hypothetical protein
MGSMAMSAAWGAIPQKYVQQTGESLRGALK